MALPLEGLRVLDLSRFLSGPYCTMVLADFGAEVLKVERPGGGDDARRLGPRKAGESYPFAMVNRNKKSLAIDLKSPEGAQIVRDLARDSDIIVENFRPGVTQRLGLDYANLKLDNPQLIYCSISGFGQSGPFRQDPGFDIIAQGMSGFMQMTGTPSSGPTKVGFAVNDIAAGTTAAHSILAAYIGMTKSGKGDYIDISLVDAGLAWTVWEAGAYFGSGEEPASTGTRHRRIAPYQAFEALDGYVVIAANTDRHWQLLCQALERIEWLDDGRYKTLEQRLENVEELTQDIERVLSQKEVQYWLTMLRKNGVPSGPVLSYAEALSHQQVVAREMVTTVDHRHAGRMKTLGIPAKMKETPLTIRGAAPTLGQHTREVLLQRGYSKNTIAALLEAGVLDEDNRGPEAPMGAMT